MMLADIDEREPLARIEQLRDALVGLDVTPQGGIASLVAQDGTRLLVPQILLKKEFELNTERMKF